jgi:DNA helicase-2/ATP-dependent DNA helicase PcrA
LLLFWRALATVSPAAAEVAGLFDHIVVDEYQDTNGLQADILTAMRRTNHNVMVVGDDAQAIYAFRSATVENMLTFTESFPGAEVVTLERNYRSTQPILDASNAVMAEAGRGFRKDLRAERSGGERPALRTCLDEARQSESVCARVLELREQGLALHDQAVLFRAAHHSAHLEIELSRRSIPFVKYGGLRFVEAAHIKDVLAGLRILENPRDELAWMRSLLLLDGVGPRSAAKIMDAMGVRNGSEASPIAAMPRVKVPPGAADSWNGLAQVLADCSATQMNASASIERLRSWYEPLFERIYDDFASRASDLEQLQTVAAAYSSRRQFLAELTLDPPASTGDLAGPPSLDDDYLVLSTIHSAKGCEWRAVHLIHAADGMIPSDLSTGSADEIEEERRLFYVALTRARDHLDVYFPLRYYHRRMGFDDAHNYAQPSRFLSSSVRAFFDEPAYHKETVAELECRESSAGSGVDDFLAGLWSG